MKKYNFLIFIGLTVSAVTLALRLINLNSLPVFADESIYIRWSQVMKAESSLRFLPLSDGKQPLFMWTTIPFLKLIEDPLLAGRVLSAICSVGLVLGSGGLSLLLFGNKRSAIYTAALMAVLPYSVFFGRMALADMMLAMFLVWTIVFSAISIKYDRWDWSIIAGFCLGFGLLTKSPAQFAFYLLPLNLLLMRWKPKLLVYLVTTYLIGYGMYNILRLGPEFHMIALRNKDYIWSFAEVLTHPIDPLIPHLKDSFIFYWYLLTPVVLGLSLWGMLGSNWKLWRSKLLVAAWWMGPVFAQSLIAKQFTARYILFTVPFAAIFAAQAIDLIGISSKKQLLSRATLSIVIILCLVLDGLMIYSPQNLPLPRIERAGYLEQWTAGYGIKEVADQVKQMALSSPVLVGSEGYFGTPFSALEMYLNKVPNVRVVGLPPVTEKIDNKLTNSVSDNKVVMVANSTRFAIDSNNTQLRLINSYPKAISPDGSQERLLFFEILPTR